MSAHVERLEPGIFRVFYDKNTSIRDLVEFSSEVGRVAEAAGDTRYVTINEFEAGFNVPLDIHHLKKAVLSVRLPVGAVMIGAPMMTQILARMLDRLTPLDIIEAKSRDEAMVLARRILAGEPVH